MLSFFAFFSAFLRARNSLKKVVKILPHSSAKTPSVTSHTWFIRESVNNECNE